jgi:hypothetical protein
MLRSSRKTPNHKQSHPRRSNSSKHVDEQESGQIPNRNKKESIRATALLLKTKVVKFFSGLAGPMTITMICTRADGVEALSLLS